MLGQRVGLEANSSPWQEVWASMGTSAAASASTTIWVVEVEAERHALRMGLAGGGPGCTALEEVWKSCVFTPLFAFSSEFAPAFVFGFSFSLGLALLMVCCGISVTESPARML